MRKINCIVVDDEPLARKGMELLIKELDYLDCLKSFENAIQVADFVKQHEVDIIFLDIEMPGITGLEFLKSVRPNNYIIFTTAYAQHAIEAFELDVIDYLLKPIRFDRFLKAVEKVKDFIILHDQQLSKIEDVQEDHFFIKADRKFIKIFYDDMIYIKGMKDYVTIHTSTGKFMTAMNVKTVNAQLPKHQFARVSKSYIINVEKLSSIDVDTVYIDQLEIPLGASYKESFIQEYVKEKLIKRK